MSQVATDSVELASLPLTVTTVELKHSHAEIRVCIGERLYLANPSSEPVSIEGGSHLMGFYKGKWVKGAQAPANGVQFTLSCGDDLVSYQNNIVPVRDLINQRKELAT